MPSASKLFFTNYPPTPFILGRTYADDYGTICTVPVYAAAQADGQIAMHPSVVYFKHGFNGYKYWMSHTPLRSGVSTHENPSIVVSNDGITWIDAPGVTNPLVPKPAPVNAFNADSFLYYDTVDNKFVLAWSTFGDGSDFTYNCYYKTSVDGETWSATGRLDGTNDAAAAYGCVSLYRDGSGLWHMWAHRNGVVPREFLHGTSSSLSGPWDIDVCTFNREPLKLWHSEVRPYRSGYVSVHQVEDAFGRFQLVMMSSIDGLAWEMDDLFPFALSWPGLVSPVGGIYPFYKAGICLGTDDNWKMWYTDSNFTNMKVATLATNPASQLADGYLQNAISQGGTLPYKIADEFARENMSLHNTAADHGGTWKTSTANNNPLIIVDNKVTWNGATGDSYLDLGAADGMVGMRVSTLPYNGYLALVARANKIVGLDASTLLLLYSGTNWTLQVYVPSAYQYLAAWNFPNIDGGSYDGLEICIRFVGSAVSVYFDGKQVAKVTLSNDQMTALSGHTEVGMVIADAATRIDKFFAHTIP